MLDSQAPRRRPVDQPAIYTHSRSRTTSSNTFPVPIQSPAPMQMPMQMHIVQQPQAAAAQAHQRRSPSVNTFSTISSGGMTMQPPPAYRTSPTADIRRSTSSHSGGQAGSPQATSYVALLRKQKATVWCDRSQYEDPRMLAQQRAAKVRANMEIVGSGSGPGGASAANSARTSTGLSSAGGKVAAKIRHHGKPAVVGYSPENNYVGVGGVPLRLSATEVEGEDSDDDDIAMQRLHHRRTGSSGRSSTASGRRVLAYRASGGLGPSGSQTGSRRWSPGDTPERTGSLVVEEEGGMPADDAASGMARSFGSGSEGERADNVPDLGLGGGAGGSAARLASNSLMNAAVTREKSVKSADDLKRRGSVDERSMTLTTGRLYIANPD